MRRLALSSLLLGSVLLLLSACGGAQTYSIALVPVPAYLNSKVPASVPKLVSVDDSFSSRDRRLTSSTSTTSGRVKTTTYRWSKENFMASGVYEASQEVAADGHQPVFVSGEFQMKAKFAAGDTYNYGWFSGHLTREK